MSRRARSTPFGFFRLRTTLFLLTFIHNDSYASVVAPGGIHMRRNSSPLGGSTLIMSAPKCPSNITQNGPARAWVKSITRMSSSAPGMVQSPPKEESSNGAMEYWSIGSDKYGLQYCNTPLFHHSLLSFYTGRNFGRVTSGVTSSKTTRTG